MYCVVLYHASKCIGSVNAPFDIIEMVKIVKMIEMMRLKVDLIHSDVMCSVLNINNTFYIQQKPSHHQNEVSSFSPFSSFEW